MNAEDLANIVALLEDVNGSFRDLAALQADIASRITQVNGIVEKLGNVFREQFGASPVNSIGASPEPSVTAMTIAPPRAGSARLATLDALQRAARPMSAGEIADAVGISAGAARARLSELHREGSARRTAHGWEA